LAPLMTAPWVVNGFFCCCIRGRATTTSLRMAVRADTKPLLSWTG
jgi:hypothetical protein